MCYPEATGDRRQFCFGRLATLLKKLVHLAKMSSSSLFPAAPPSQASTVGVHPKPTEKPQPSDKNVSIFHDASRTHSQPGRQLKSKLAPNSGTPELKNTVPVPHSLNLRYIYNTSSYMYIRKTDKQVFLTSHIQPLVVFLY